MTVGMSAPPMGMISSTPNSVASPMITGNTVRAAGAVGCSTNSTPRTRAAPSTPRLTKFCPG